MVRVPVLKFITKLCVIEHYITVGDKVLRKYLEGLFPSSG